MPERSTYPILVRQPFLIFLFVVVLLVLLKLCFKQMDELDDIRALTGIHGTVSKQLAILKAVCDSQRGPKDTCELRYLARRTN